MNWFNLARRSMSSSTRLAGQGRVVNLRIPENRKTCKFLKNLKIENKRHVYKIWKSQNFDFLKISKKIDSF